MPENKDKIKEIQENIQKWENELEEVWKDKNTDAAEVERRNLRNYIANAKKEIEELEGNKVEGQGKEEIKPEELLKDLKEEKETKAQADSKKNAEKNRIKLEIERLKEEREDYKNDKSIYEEYGKKIEELEGRLEDEKEEEKTQEQKDAQIKTLTQGRMNVEKEIQETEKEIRLKKREIEDVKFETEEIVLESGEKTKVPKVLGLYKELDKLEDKLRLQKNQKEEYQKAINELKGIEEKEIKDLNSEEIRYFHGQGDYREKTGEAGEDLRENRLGNDEYYRQGKSSRPIERVTTTPVEPKTEEDKEIEEEPPKIPTDNLKENNLPIRSFWEIYNDTCTEHANNFSIKLHNFAHMKVLPRKEEDAITKTLSGVLIPLKLVTKAAAIIPNKIAKTDKKLEEMQEKIDKLSPQEFQVLVSSSDKVNMMFGDHIKDSFDRDYLDPQFMKNYKVNELYLKAVGGRLTRERVAGIEFYKEQISNCNERISELNQISKHRQLEPEEQQEYNELTNRKQQFTDKGKELRQEIDVFNDGVKKKSSGFKNISGWFMGKFNPDNRSENAEMAKLSKERREVAETGNGMEISKLTNKMSKYAASQTVIKGSKNTTIDRGNYSIEESIEMLDKGQENRGRLLLTNVALITSAVDLAKQITNAKNNQNIINDHNETVSKANAENKNIEVSGNVKASDMPGAKEAQEGLARHTVESGFNRSERANLDANNWQLGSSGYKAGDVITHNDASIAIKNVNQAISKGNSEEALKIATEYFSKNAAAQEKAMKGYMDTHNFDYSAINYGSSQDMKAIMDFFQGTMHYNKNVAGTMVSTIEGIDQGINPLAAIFASANTLYQAQKQGVKDSWKESLKNSKKKDTDQIEENKDNAQNKEEHEYENEI